MSLNVKWQIKRSFLYLIKCEVCNIHLFFKVTCLLFALLLFSKSNHNLIGHLSNSDNSAKAIILDSIHRRSGLGRVQRIALPYADLRLLFGQCCSMAFVKSTIASTTGSMKNVSLFNKRCGLIVMIRSTT